MSGNFRGRGNKARGKRKHRPKGRSRASYPHFTAPHMIRPVGNDCPILNLNQDCLLKIFSYLSREELLNIDKVSPLWKSVADLIWRKFTTFDCTEYFQYYLDKKSLKVLSRCGPYIKKIHFPFLVNENEYAQLLNVIACNCPNIEAAHLNEFFFLKSTMKNFTKIFKRVKYLVIADEDTLIESKTLKSILQKAPELISLTFKNISTESRFSFHSCFPFAFHTMKEFYFGKMEPPVSKFFIDLPEFCPNLEVLSMSTSLTDVKITPKIKKLTKLRILELENCELSLEQMEKFLCLTQLEKLAFTVSKEMNDEFLKKIVSSIPNLNNLDVSGALRRNVTDKGVEELAKLQNLEHLNLSYYKMISVAGIETVALNGKLKNLYLISTSVTDNVVTKVLSHCHNLRFLDLSACTELTSKALDDLTNIFHPGNTRPTLTVTLGGNNNVKCYLLDPNKRYDTNLQIKDFINNSKYRLRKRLKYIDDGGQDEFYVDSDDSDYDCFSDNDFSDDSSFGYCYDSDDCDDVYHDMHWYADSDNEWNHVFYDGFEIDVSDL